MSRVPLVIAVLAVLATAAVALAACSTEPSSLDATPSSAKASPNTPLGTQAAPLAPVNAPIAEAQRHRCSKVTFVGLVMLLASRGVNLSSTANGSAAKLFREGLSAFGAPNFSGRVGEQIIPGASALGKEYDILVAAAPEIAAKL